MNTFGTLEPFMEIAIEEARQSLREGNHGFGAVILRDRTVLAQAHDEEQTERDPTSHAERNAIRMACSRIGTDFSGTTILSTHEPCPMCAGAILRAGIPHVVYGYGVIGGARLGSDRVEPSTESLFREAGVTVRVEKGLLREECSMLYSEEVRAELSRLRGASNAQLREYDRMLSAKRIKWYREQGQGIALAGKDAVERGYQLLLHRLRISEAQAPVVHREKGRIVFHSKNFCPTLQACLILGLDTRKVCRLSNEGATNKLIQQIDPKLRFRRNYETIRPHSECCEECIEYR